MYPIFNLCSDQIFKEAIEMADYGVKINKVPLITIRYANLTIILSDIIEERQECLE